MQIDPEEIKQQEGGSSEEAESQDMRYSKIKAGTSSQLTRDSYEPSETLINGKNSKYTVKPHEARFPLCIVWTPLPMITQLIPCIGHTGIGDSKGVIYDFAGPYYVSKDDLAFGETHKYVVLELDGVTEEAYNEAISEANRIYKRRMHNICCDNCHSHVARVLNTLKYKGKSSYTMIHVWWMCLMQGTYVECKHIFYTYVGWLLAAVIGLLCWLLPMLNGN